MVGAIIVSHDVCFGGSITRVIYVFISHSRGETRAGRLWSEVLRVSSYYFSKYDHDKYLKISNAIILHEQLEILSPSD